MNNMHRASAVALFALFWATQGVCGTNGVRVSDFGYAADDSTRFIQAALDSGARRVVLDRRSESGEAPFIWHSEQIYIRSNTELVFEPGVELVAKRGAFTSVRRPFVVLEGVTNVTIRGGTIRMWKCDYQKPPYAKSEWRHAILMRAAVNVLLEDMLIADSGGDGLALSGISEHWVSKDYSRNVTIRRCVFDGNHRQGISVFDVDGMLIEDTILSNTCGTAPEAGIDFEPDLDSERLVNCVMRNCLSVNNHGRGYDLYLPNIFSNSVPVSIRFENCRSLGNAASLRVDTANHGCRGRVDFKDCSFEDPKEEAILLSGIYKGGLSVAFDRCKIANAKSDVILRNSYVRGHPDKLSFRHLEVFQPSRRDWFKCTDMGRSLEPGSVDGEAFVYPQTGERYCEKLDAAWNAAHLPALNGGKPMPPMRDMPPIDGVVAVDAHPGEMAELSVCALPWRARYVFFVDSPEKVRFVGRQTRWHRDSPLAKEPIVIGEIGSASTWNVPRPQESSTEFVFDAPRRGFYRMALPERETGPRFQLEKSSVPVAIDFDRTIQSVLQPNRRELTLWLDAPEAADLAVAQTGSSWYGNAAKLVSPDGKVASMCDVAGGEIFVHAARSASAGLWRLELSPTAKAQDAMSVLELYGFRPYAFLSLDKFWKVVTR